MKQVAIDFLNFYRNSNWLHEFKSDEQLWEEFNKDRPTDKYKHCNHHHELTSGHQMVDFWDGEFVANKEAIPLLKALAELGLRTRSHHIDGGEHAWICILLDNVQLEIREVFEKDSTRTKYNGKKEVLISWRKPKCCPFDEPIFNPEIKELPTT